MKTIKTRGFCSMLFMCVPGTMMALYYIISGSVIISQIVFLGDMTRTRKNNNNKIIAGNNLPCKLLI